MAEYANTHAPVDAEVRNERHHLQFGSNGRRNLLLLVAHRIWLLVVFSGFGVENRVAGTQGGGGNCSNTSSGETHHIKTYAVVDPNRIRAVLSAGDVEVSRLDWIVVFRRGFWLTDG